QFDLVDRASEPDALARGNPDEERHHFINADAYGSFPFRRLRQQFVIDRLGPTVAEARNGDVMWQIDRFGLRLTSDFRGDERGRILHDAVFAAHYAADLTQPLHTVSNYDGQRTGQRGIHQAFETGVVDLNADRWILRPRAAGDIRDLRAAIFSEFLKSYQSAPIIFAADRQVRGRWRPGDAGYLRALSRQLGPFTQNRIEDAAWFVASLWYTAWRNAGSPDLRSLR
ncbi:MAG: hypothetical protein ACRD10_03580, partial [Terriglobia bacterium]